MKTKKLGIMLIVLIIILFVNVPTLKAHTNIENGDLTVEITNINNPRGFIQLGLFNNSQSFPSESKQFMKVRIKPNGKTTSYTFKDLPEGNYAVAVLHDENSDGKCNMNIIGIPKEGYGFSNNIKPTLSAPSFAKVQFSLSKNMKISIKLIY